MPAKYAKLRDTKDIKLTRNVRAKPNITMRRFELLCFSPYL